MKMKLSLIFTAALLFVTVRANGTPRLTLPESSFDFGYAPQNSKVTHVFWMHSTGDDTLKILKVIPGCGCTKAPVEKNLLKVGDSTRLEIIFSTKKYTNSVYKKPKIQTNEGPPDKSVTIHATVVARPDSTYPIILNPFKIDLSQFTKKVIDKAVFTVRNVSDRKLSLKLVGGVSDLIEVKLPESVGPGKTVEGEIKLTESAYDKSFDKSITIELDDEQTSRFTLPIKRSYADPKSKRSDLTQH